MEMYKENIINQLIRLNQGKVNLWDDTIIKIDLAVWWAWENWNDAIISTFYDASYPKPIIPPENFIKQWVENEDFEADGYDVGQLQELFG